MKIQAVGGSKQFEQKLCVVFEIFPRPPTPKLVGDFSSLWTLFNRVSTPHRKNFFDVCIVSQIMVKNKQKNRNDYSLSESSFCVSDDSSFIFSDSKKFSSQ